MGILPLTYPIDNGRYWLNFRQYEELIGQPVPIQLPGGTSMISGILATVRTCRGPDGRPAVEFGVEVDGWTPVLPERLPDGGGS